jgi:hypothetical protein
MLYSSYYQARVEKSQTWFVVGVLRSFEHLVFDRTIDKERGIIEYYVPADLEQYFLEVMEYFAAHNIVHDLVKLPNRLQDPQEEV